MSKKLLFIICFILSLGFITVLFLKVPYVELFDAYRHANKLYLFLSFVAFFVSFFFSIIRWKYILRALRIKLSFREAMYAGFSSQFFNFSPASFLGGDLFRTMSIVKRHGHLKQVASSVLLDRFSGSTALAFISMWSFFFGINLLPHRQVIIPLCTIWVVIGIAALHIFSKRVFLFSTTFLRKTKFKQKLENFQEQLYFFRKKPVVFFTSLIFSVLIQIFTVASFIITAQSFSLHVNPTHFFILVPIIAVIAMLPITIAGIGTRDAAAIYFFSLVGISHKFSFGMSLLNFVFMLIVAIFGGILYLSVYHKWLHKS